MKNVALHNLGCKVNSYEIDVVQQKLQEKGYKIVPFDGKADIYIVNTCSVTNIADRKSRQMLHRAKKQNPEAIVVAMGCYVQAGEEKALEDECIDLAVGNNRKKDIVDIIETFMERKQQRKLVDLNETSIETLIETPINVSINSTSDALENADNKEEVLKEAEANFEKEEIAKANLYKEKTLDYTTIIDINHTDEYEEMQLTKTAEHTRAYIKIQDGCNQFCTYCIIPYARGRVRSRKVKDILTEVTSLRDSGYKEIVLTGIHISSYGIDVDKQSHLLDLIQEIHNIEGIERIRLGSLEPRIVTEEFAKALASLHKICPHFHLSLQSGCDKTLKAMNRRYDTKEFYEKVCILRKYFEQPAITTDVIVGFPQETEEDFTVTKEFLEKVSFFEMHIFPYSKRAGTRAAAMDGQLTEAVKKERSQVLLQLEKKQSEEYRRSFLGKEVEVLFEEEKEMEGEIYFVGHTKEYIKVGMKTNKNLANVIVKGLTTKLMGDMLMLEDSQCI